MSANDSHDHLGQVWDANQSTITLDPSVGLRLLSDQAQTGIDVDAGKSGFGIKSSGETGIEIDASLIGVNTIGRKRPLVGVNTSGVYIGVSGRVGELGTGVYGVSTGSNVNTQGVAGRHTGSEGAAVSATTTSRVGQTYGVRAKSNSESGVGVRGHATGGRNEGAEVTGVEGVSDGGFDSAGVHGIATGSGTGVRATGVNYGVRADSRNVGVISGYGSSETLYGVLAKAKIAGVRSSGNLGCYSVGRDGYGLLAVSKSGDAGVLGQSDGIGVRGVSRGDLEAEAFGVKGEGEIGVRGLGDHTGVSGYGDVAGVWASSTNGYGVVAYSSTGQAVRCGTKDGKALYCDGVADFQGDVEIRGDIRVAGSKSFVETVETDDGTKEVVYQSVESGRSLTEHSGVGTLKDGRAEVQLPEHFRLVTSERDPLVVQVTPHGGERGVRVVKRSLDGFTVEDLAEGNDDDATAEYEFSYTVKGTRAGYEGRAVIRDSVEREQNEDDPTERHPEGFFRRPSDSSTDENARPLGDSTSSETPELTEVELPRTDEDPIERELRTRPREESVATQLVGRSPGEIERIAREERFEEDATASALTGVEDADELAQRIRSLERRVEELTTALEERGDRSE
jgi:hypothetical protein